MVADTNICGFADSGKKEEYRPIFEKTISISYGNDTADEETQKKISLKSAFFKAKWTHLMFKLKNALEQEDNDKADVHFDSIFNDTASNIQFRYAGRFALRFNIKINPERLSSYLWASNIAQEDFLISSNNKQGTEELSNIPDIRKMQVMDREIVATTEHFINLAKKQDLQPS